MFWWNPNKLKMILLTLVMLLVCYIYSGIAQDVSTCGINRTCNCCNSNPNNGSRILLDICKNQISGWSCTYGCRDGYYGGKCYNYCPEYCIRCAPNFGAKNSQDYQICYICAGGYYNGTGITNCSTPCPANCAKNQCDKRTGMCSLGCTGNWMGAKCNICAATWYGNSCDIRCPETCKDRICDRNGGCTNGCVDDNFTGSKCNQCRTGMHGDICEKSCPVNCRGDTCNRTDGVCTNGCKDIFYGDICDKCKPYYYGANCDSLCPSNCHNGECSKEDGTCKSCEDKYYGKTCNMTCPDNCQNNVCGQYDGVCNNCSVGYYRRSCDYKCQSGCIGDTCTQDSGECTFGCDNGNSCNHEPQRSYHTGEIIGGVIAGFTIITVLSHVLCIIWRRRQSRKPNEDSTIQVNAIYENDKADPDGYEELQISNH